MPSAMSSSSILPLEIEEIVIDFLAENDKDLLSVKACSLGSRASLPLCRKHIFGSIVLNNRKSDAKSASSSATSRKLERLQIQNSSIIFGNWITALYPRTTPARQFKNAWSEFLGCSLLQLGFMDTTGATTHFDQHSFTSYTFQPSLTSGCSPASLLRRIFHHASTSRNWNSAIIRSGQLKTIHFLQLFLIVEWIYIGVQKRHCNHEFPHSSTSRWTTSHRL